jgi:hypothetical protein
VSGLPSKKTLSFSQNIENKGMEFPLPPRSMVLKVVTGRILKTWKLRRCPTACGSVVERRGGTGLGVKVFIFSSVIVGCSRCNGLLKDFLLSYR